MNVELLTGKAVDCGATKAAVVSQDGIVLDPEYRAMCEANRCRTYGKCYMCPPDVGTAEELMGRVRGYSRGLLYQLVSPLDDSFDIEGMRAAAAAFHALSQRVMDALRPVLGDGALYLSSGGCGLCAVCGKVTGEPCRHPDRAQPSLESVCMDVSKTAKNAGLKYVNGTNTVTYFGMVLYDDE